MCTATFLLNGDAPTVGVSSYPDYLVSLPGLNAACDPYGSNIFCLNGSNKAIVII